MGAEFLLWMMIPALILSAWVFHRLNIGAIDFLIDPRGVLSLMVVVWVALVVLAMFIIQLVASVLHFISSTMPWSLALIIPLFLGPAFIGWRIFPRRRLPMTDF